MSDWRDEEMARRARGEVRALSQNVHEAINARHYPGTRQLCVQCDEPTGRCEEDSIYVEDIGPICEACLDAVEAAEQETCSKLDAAMIDGQPPRIKLSAVPPTATIVPSGIAGVSFTTIDGVVYFVDLDTP